MPVPAISPTVQAEYMSDTSFMFLFDIQGFETEARFLFSHHNTLYDLHVMKVGGGTPGQGSSPGAWLWAITGPNDGIRAAIMTGSFTPPEGSGLWFHSDVMSFVLTYKVDGRLVRQSR